MKTNLLKVAIAIICIAISAPVFSQITLPRTPSPAAAVTQTIGISTVTVNYSRPKVNGREIWGKLVPFGYNVEGFGLGNPSPWRAGANENTTIELSHDAKIEGQHVPAGKYGLFFVINADNSGEVILSRDNRSWGHYFYDPKNDQMKSAIKIREHAMTELLTYEFVNLSKNGGELVLNWERKQFPVNIQFDVDHIVMANATEELKGPAGFTAAGPISAANYALVNKVNEQQALKWIDQALNQNRSFQALQIKAGLLKNTGKSADADKLMKDAMTTATEAEINQYGYQLLAQGETDKAIEIFTINTERHPKSANTFDSLGEAYATKGDKKNAIKNFRKALEMNPAPNVKANSEKFLKQLGAM